MKASRRPECCPTCGRPALPESLSSSFPPVQRRIVTLIERHGEMHRDILWTAIYGSDPNGGPISRQILDVHIAKINKRLRPHGVAIRRRRFHYRGEPWRFVPIMEAAE